MEEQLNKIYKCKIRIMNNDLINIWLNSNTILSTQCEIKNANLYDVCEIIDNRILAYYRKEIG